jgi:hypothetical protein
VLAGDMGGGEVMEKIKWIPINDKSPNKEG